MKRNNVHKRSSKDNHYTDGGKRSKPIRVIYSVEDEEDMKKNHHTLKQKYSR